MVTLIQLTGYKMATESMALTDQVYYIERP